MKNKECKKEGCSNKFKPRGRYQQYCYACWEEAKKRKELKLNQKNKKGGEKMLSETQKKWNSRLSSDKTSVSQLGKEELEQVQGSEKKQEKEIVDNEIELKDLPAEKKKNGRTYIPEIQKKVVELYQEGKSYKDIAKYFNGSPAIPAIKRWCKKANK